LRNLEPTVASGSLGLADLPAIVSNALAGTKIAAEPDSSDVTQPPTVLAPLTGQPGISSPPARDDVQDRTSELGKVLAGRYTLVSILGKGGMGTVYKARDRNREGYAHLHPFVALKLLNEDLKLNPEACRALQTEALRAQILTDEHIVRVNDFDSDQQTGRAFMTMEYLEGQTLAEWLQNSATGTASNDRWKIVQSICQGLSCAHKHGIVHSDLKPGNVFICKSGDVKVMDFGIARQLQAITGQTGIPPGLADGTFYDPAKKLGALTLAYASLEQLQEEDPDPRDDLYALGCVVYYLFAGHHPFAKMSERDGLRISALNALNNGWVPLRIKSLTRWRQWRALREALALSRAERIASVDLFVRRFAPLTFWQQYRAVLVAAAVASVAAGLFFGLQYFRDFQEDQALNLKLWPAAKAPAVVLSADQKRDVDDYLYLAQQAIDQATRSTSADELSLILSKGDNNLLELLTQIRTLDPLNAKALDLTAEAARLYEKRARALESAHQLPQALKMVLEGQSFQHNFGLFRVKRELCSRQLGLCAD
jgi:serine/threonine protein kinase